MSPYLPAFVALCAIVAAAVAVCIAEAARRAWRDRARELEASRAEVETQLASQEQKAGTTRRRLAASEASREALSARIQSATTDAINAKANARHCAEQLEDAHAVINSLLRGNRICPDHHRFNAISDEEPCPHCRAMTSKSLHV